MLNPDTVDETSPTKATHFFQLLNTAKSSRSKWMTHRYLFVGANVTAQKLTDKCISLRFCTARDIKRNRVRIVKAYVHEKEPFFIA